MSIAMEDSARDNDGNELRKKTVELAFPKYQQGNDDEYVSKGKGTDVTGIHKKMVLVLIRWYYVCVLGSKQGPPTTPLHTGIVAIAVVPFVMLRS
jgi:hypothetical protein